MLLGETKTSLSALEVLGYTSGDEPWVLISREIGTAKRSGRVEIVRKLYPKLVDALVLAAAEYRAGFRCFDCRRFLTRYDIHFDHRPPLLRKPGDKQGNTGHATARLILYDDPRARDVVVVCADCEAWYMIYQANNGLIGQSRGKKPRRYAASIRASRARFVLDEKLELEPHCDFCRAAPAVICDFGHREPVRGNRPFGCSSSLAEALRRGDYPREKLWRISPYCHFVNWAEEKRGGLVS